MRELLRSNDLVRLSFIEAVLSDAGIDVLVMDHFTSAVEGSIGALPRRVMVDEDELDRARTLVAAMEDEAGASPDFGIPASVSAGEGTGITGDRFHAGRVEALQPVEGYRAAIDPVLLAASLDRPVHRHRHRLLDVGCGAGVASLCAASLIRALPENHPADVTITGIDIDRTMLDLASRSIARNGYDHGNVTIDVGVSDISDASSWPEAGGWDQVFSNPPYLEAGTARGRARPDADTANMETTVDLKDWVGFMIAMAKPKGRLVLVHRADRVSEITAAFRQGGVGAIEIFPFWPKQGAAAKRVIVRGRKGVRTADRLLPGMVLHRADGSFTDDAEAVLNGDAWLPFADG